MERKNALYSSVSGPVHPFYNQCCEYFTLEGHIEFDFGDDEEGTKSNEMGIVRIHQM